MGLKEDGRLVTTLSGDTGGMEWPRLVKLLGSVQSGSPILVAALAVVKGFMLGERSRPKDRAMSSVTLVSTNPDVDFETPPGKRPASNLTRTIQFGLTTLLVLSFEGMSGDGSHAPRLVIFEGLDNLIMGVHYKGPVGGNGLLYRLPA